MASRISHGIFARVGLRCQSILQGFPRPVRREQTPPIPSASKAMASLLPARAPPAPELSPAACRPAPQAPRCSVSLVPAYWQEAPEPYSPRKQNQTSGPISPAAEINPLHYISLRSLEIASAPSEWLSRKCRKLSFRIPTPPIAPRHLLARTQSPAPSPHPSLAGLLSKIQRDRNLPR